MGLKDLPLDNGARIAKVFELGFNLHFEGLSEKNHFIFTDPNNPHVFISIPNHDEVDRSTLKAEIRKLHKTDAQFIEKYNAIHKAKKIIQFQQEPELEVCCLCHEDILPNADTVPHKDNGLRTHRECHQRTFGTA